MNWRKEDLKNLKECLVNWEDYPEMRESYPDGLSQYLRESNYGYDSMCDLIVELHEKTLDKR